MLPATSPAAAPDTFRLHRHTLCTLLLAIPALAWSQATPQVPNIGSALKEVESAQPAPPPHRDADPVIIDRDETPLYLPTGDTLRVDQFRLEGAEFADEAALQALLAPYKGRTLDMAQIDEAASRITQHYRSQGYVIARTYVPRQDASNGTLTLRVLVGRYGDIAVKNQSLVRDGIVQGPFLRLKEQAGGPDGTPVTHAQLERAMLLVRDMPGAAMPELVVSPGQAPGTSDFDIDVPAGPRVQGYALIDNQGSRYTGKERLSAGLDINSLLGLGDRLSFSGMTAKDKGLLNGRVAYGFPLATNGLRMELAAARTTYELGDIYRDLDATGRSTSLEAALSYPILRSNTQNLNLFASAAARRLRDDIGLTNDTDRKKARTGTIGLQHDAWSSLFGRSLYTTATTSITFGRLSFDDAAKEAANRASIDTAGSYARLNLSLSANHALSDKFSLSLTASAQKALKGKNLDSSEQMSIAGANGVRAYREVVSGDNAYLLNAELRYQLPAIGGLKHSMGVFADTGRAWYADGSAMLVNGTRLSDVGLGYYANYDKVMLKVILAHAVGGVPDHVALHGRSHVYAQAALVF